MGRDRLVADPALGAPGDEISAALATDPHAAAAWREAAQMTLRQECIKRSSLFESLSPACARELAAYLTPRAEPAGAVIVREGERAGKCYLIHDGEVAIVSSLGASNEREQTRIGPGGLFGEEILLQDAPYSASVRATKDCRLLSLGSVELMRTIAADRRVAARILDMVLLRDKPRPVAGVVAFPQAAVRGEQIVVLKDPARHRYFRLSEDGWRLWQSLDGDLTVRELIIEQLRLTGRFAPQAVLDLLRRLTAAGLIENVRPIGMGNLMPQSWQSSAVAWLIRILTWRIHLTGCDRWLSGIYTGGARLLFTPAALVSLAAIGAAGVAGLVFALWAGRVTLAPTHSSGPPLWLFYVAIIVSIVLHEAGHAFTAKFFGREVDRIGFGWFWFAPIAFVDTSDMWIARRWPRVAVDLAGVSVNAICAGFATLAALLIGSGGWAAILWQFVLVSWWMVLGNLNPLFEFDGYYALSDWLDRPNLRSQAMARLWQPGAWRIHHLELGYAVAVLAYVAAMGALMIGTYNSLLANWIAGELGSSIASMGGFLIALAFALIAAMQCISAKRGRL
jgi:putative peptide zinc metalloprotease protein